MLLIPFILLFFILVFFLVYSRDFFSTLSSAPFIRVPKNILPKIIEALDIKDGSVVYDLGCGDGRVLLECYKHNKNSKYIGIEKSITAYLLAKIKTRKIGNISILLGDFFKKDLSDATRVFLYILPSTMDKLFPKLERELKKDSIVVSCSFEFSRAKPVKTIESSKKIFIYNF
jgi:SAM-dependent methyltransferase